MVTRIIIIVVLLLAEASVGYYSLAVNDSLFWRFIFFLSSAALVCLMVIKGIQYILPSEDYHESEEESK